MDTKPLQRLFRPEDGGQDEDDLKLLFETSGGEGGILSRPFLKVMVKPAHRHNILCLQVIQAVFCFVSPVLICPLAAEFPLNPVSPVSPHSTFMMDFLSKVFE